MSAQALPHGAGPTRDLMGLLARAVMGREPEERGREDAPVARPLAGEAREPDRDAEDMAFLRRLREAGL